MDTLVWFLAAGLISYLLARVLKHLREPKLTCNDSFHCNRCGTVVRHSHRTLKAHNSGIRRYYCGKCHKAWRDAQTISTAAPRRWPLYLMLVSALVAFLWFWLI